MTRHGKRIATAVAATALVTLAVLGGWWASRPPTSVTVRDQAIAVERTLRCPTCQGLSVADSPSSIAAGIRQQVEQQLLSGATAAQVRGYFTARYGDWILLAPPGRGIGWLVWAAPPLLITVGLLLLCRTLRRQGPRLAEPTQDDLVRAAAFAADPPHQELPEPVAAALAELTAARVETELDPDARAAEQALVHLAGALRRHPDPAGADPEESAPTADTARAAAEPASGARRRPARYALPAAVAVFTGLIAVTLSRAVAQRPAGAVPTGTFATAGAGTGQAAPSPSPTPTGAQLAALAAATRARPNDPQVWLQYATRLDAAGRWAAAEPAYRRALALDPTAVAAREQLAWLLTRGGSPAEALTLLAPLTRQRPNDPRAVLLLGLAQRGAGAPEAAATLRRYLRLAPTTAQAAMVRILLGESP